MATLNRVQLIGNLGRDPELRYTANRTPVATLSVATTHRLPDKDNPGEEKEATEWHRVVVWSKLAEQCALYLAKGRSVYVEGRLQTRTWDDTNGQKHATTEIVAQIVQFLGPKPANEDRPIAPPEPLGARLLTVAKAGTESWSGIPF